MTNPLDLIDTIVFVMMENRSFDHVLGHLSAPPVGRTEVDGIREDSTWMAGHSNTDTDGKTYSPAVLTQPGHPLPDDPPHERPNIALQIGQSTGGVYPMDGFIKNCNTKLAAGTPFVMGYYKAESVFAASFFAQNFAICDRWFSSLPAGTQPNRLMAFAGSSKIDLNSKFLLQRQPLVYDWLDQKGISWRVYHEGLPFFALMEGWQERILFGEHFRSYENFRHDNKTEAGESFPQVVFIEPRFTSAPHLQPATDEHAPSPITPGQRFLLRVYSDLVANPARWSRTLMVITYDEHGGFYDHVSPLPTNLTSGGDYPAFTSTGVRVPGYLVSPLVPAGSVFHGVVDHTAFLKLLAAKFAPGQGYSPDVDGRRIANQPVAELAAAMTLTTPRNQIPYHSSLRKGLNPDQTHEPDATFYALKQGLDRMRSQNPAKVENKFPETGPFYGPPS